MITKKSHHPWFGIKNRIRFTGNIFKIPVLPVKMPFFWVLNDIRSKGG